jgi:hypothetical protein
MKARSSRRNGSSMALACVAALALAAAAACGNLTAGGFTEVTVAVSGDAPDPVLGPAPLLAPSPQSMPPLPTSHETEGAEGQIEIDFTLALVSESEDVVLLGEDDIRVKIDLQGLNEAEAVRELVPAARYVELRIAFTHIQVQVESGLVIDGEPVVGDIEVSIEDPELLVTRPLNLNATDGGSVEMVVDLNAQAWLAAVDPVTKTVDASVFAELVDLVVR